MDKRRVFRVLEDGEEQVEMQDLKKGDRFRIEPFDESDGKHVNGETILTAVSDGYIDRHIDGKPVCAVQTDLEENIL